MPAPLVSFSLPRRSVPAELRAEQAFSPAQLQALLRAKLRKRRVAERRQHLTRDLMGPEHVRRS